MTPYTMETELCFLPTKSDILSVEWQGIMRVVDGRSIFVSK